MCVANEQLLSVSDAAGNPAKHYDSL